MRETGKLDYLEFPAVNGTLDNMKAFYAGAFGWAFTDYGSGYSAFSEGIDGGFDGSTESTKILPVLFSENLEVTQRQVEELGGQVIRPIFLFPGGRRFHFIDPAGNEMAVWSDI